MAYHHVTAMLSEAVASLSCRPGDIIVDGTLGGCGHAEKICEKIGKDGVFIGIDQDKDAVENAEKVLASFETDIHIFHGNFVHLRKFLSQIGIRSVDGILIDIGLSLHQLQKGGRGFSFLRNEPLDMRMDVRADTTAADLVSRLGEKELADLFYRYGEEKWSGKIARKLVEARRRTPIETSSQLADLVSEAVPARFSRKQKIHPATRVFQALRIAVNKELDVLESFIGDAVELLNPGGRLVVLSFHSLEDRIVKQRFRGMAFPCTCPPDFPQCACGRKPKVRLITKKVLRPGQAEIKKNPMARSTRLRALEKI